MKVGRISVYCLESYTTFNFIAKHKGLKLMYVPPSGLFPYYYICNTQRRKLNARIFVVQICLTCLAGI